jgi:hypothetical protein
MVEGCVEPLEEMKAAFHAHRCDVEAEDSLQYPERML